MTTANAPATLRRADERPLGSPAILLMVVLALVTIGVLVVYSASRTVEPAGINRVFRRHLELLVPALGLLALGSAVPYRWLNRWYVAAGGLALAVALLVLVLYLGEERNHVRRWFTAVVAGVPFSFQPSEFAKLALVVFLAWLFSRRDVEMGRFWPGFVVAMGSVALVCGLVALEDFGTAVLIGAVGALVCLIAGCCVWHFVALVPVAAGGFWFAVWRVPWRLERLMAFVNPWQHQGGAGWHVCQSLMAIGSGGLLGVGLGGGIQKFYLPERTTDFIFAVLCEEMGILGGILVLGLYGVFVWRGGRVVRDAPDRFGFLLASGILLVVGLQAATNIGVVTGALPAKGIGLPFISYGGSGLAMMSLAAGLLVSVARSAARPARRRADPLVFRSTSGRAVTGAQP